MSPEPSRLCFNKTLAACAAGEPAGAQESVSRPERPGEKGRERLSLSSVKQDPRPAEPTGPLCWNPPLHFTNENQAQRGVVSSPQPPS